MHLKPDCSSEQSTEIDATGPDVTDDRPISPTSLGYVAYEYEGERHFYRDSAASWNEALHVLTQLKKDRQDNNFDDYEKVFNFWAQEDNINDIMGFADGSPFRFLAVNEEEELELPDWNYELIRKLKDHAEELIQEYRKRYPSW